MSCAEAISLTPTRLWWRAARQGQGWGWTVTSQTVERLGGEVVVTKCPPAAYSVVESIKIDVRDSPAAGDALSQVQLSARGPPRARPVS
jgi:hypothetical protein